MTNDSNNTTTDIYLSDIIYLGYYNLLTVILGSIFNLSTFIVLCRPIFLNAQVRSTIYYMRAIALIDFIGLYGWNFDSYLGLLHGFTLFSSYTVASCKFFSFLNYFTNQASSWLHVFVCFDRYLVLSHIQPNPWFNRSKNVLIIIGFINGFFILFNLHFFLFVCYEDSNGQINIDSKFYQLYPLYDRIHLFIYNIIPSFLIILLNSFSIYYLTRLKQTTRIQNSQIRHRTISITLISTSCLFVITRTPSSLIYGFFYNDLSETIPGRRIINAFDLFLYTFPLLNFPIYLITFTDFRRELFRLLMRNRVVLPMSAANIQPTIGQIQLRNVPNK